jgi:hypothetical protein
VTTVWADGTVFRRMYGRNFDRQLASIPSIPPELLDLSEFGL